MDSPRGLFWEGGKLFVMHPPDLSVYYDLENTGKPLKTVADDCGFASEEALRRAFMRRVGVAPGHYRERFGTPGR